MGYRPGQRHRRELDQRAASVTLWSGGQPWQAGSPPGARGSSNTQRLNGPSTKTQLGLKFNNNDQARKMLPEVTCHLHIWTGRRLPVQSKAPLGPAVGNRPLHAQSPPCPSSKVPINSGWLACPFGPFVHSVENPNFNLAVMMSLLLCREVSPNCQDTSFFETGRGREEEVVVVLVVVRDDYLACLVSPSSLPQ